MSGDGADLVSQLSEDEAWELLSQHEVGRLATTAGGVLDIFPITYVVDNRTLVFRTAPGTKLVELTVNDHVAFEIDHYDDESGYSVVIHGTAERLESMGDIDRAKLLPLPNLFPTERPRYVRIHPTDISARRFIRAK
jgi:nitroimidazol reductase NimA-like FMN-containing flavoprotein (pyridoxamine 5'-phosphate oxidase superfamily)